MVPDCAQKGNREADLSCVVVWTYFIPHIFSLILPIFAVAKIGRIEFLGE